MTSKIIVSTFLMTALAGGLLSGCVPATTSQTSAASNNLSLEMRRLNADFNRQEQLLNELNERLSRVESQLAEQEQKFVNLRQQPSPTIPGSSVLSDSSSSQPDTFSTMPQTGLSPTEVYLQAFGNYASGRYPEAIAGFETFLQRFPNNSYASNAQFWLGDCYFNQQQYTKAIQQFQKVLEDYLRAPKQPDALLKIAEAQLQLGNTEEAIGTVELLKAKHPDSSAAQKANDLNLP